MPGRLSKKKEKYWDEAKDAVRKSTDKSQKKFTDKDWGLTQMIFQLKKKKHMGKTKKKKKADIVSNMVKLANQLDSDGLYEYATEVDNILEELV